MNDGNMDKDRNGGKKAERGVKEAGNEGRRENVGGVGLKQDKRAK